jgi:iron complex outermembrane receptor protein
MSLATAPAGAAPQGTAAQPPATAQPKPDPQKPDPTKPDPPKPEDPVRVPGETLVVSDSKGQVKLVNATSTMSLITTEQIALAASQNFPEVMRQIPGVNITQVGVRDINVTTRGSTGTLATGQLALLDGRSLYQDFFGFVMWDFLPVNLNEVKQIEVIRGPASAVWGANALNGVINVITKSPREMQGTSAVMGFGSFDRARDGDSGSLWYVSGTHAAAINGRWAYKLSGGGFSQEELSRPTGVIPCTYENVCSETRASYPAFVNQGSTQPKFDARLDYDYPDGRKLSFSGGIAGTDGLMHTGIGPFDIASGTTMAYGKVNYSKGAFRAALFTNALQGDANNLLSVNPLTGQPITFDFTTNTYDLDVSNVQTFGGRHALTYGGNFRLNFFDLSIAPTSDDRTEFGVFAQGEIALSEKMFRLVVGARVDRFDYIDDFVFSPRTALLIKPHDNHTFRVSYSRAYRAPSVINNHLDLVIAEPAPLTAIGGPANYLLPVNITGNTDLEETSLDAFELGYSAALGRTVLSAAFYNNWIKNEILFTQDPAYNYTTANPPANWPVSPVFIDIIAAQGRILPGRLTYLNFGKYTQRGLELGFTTTLNNNFDVFGNYSWQAEPEPDGFDLSELNLPATNRFNAGVSANYGRFLGSVSVSYSDSAYWQDVLTESYAGTTEPYTLVNGSIGARWMGNRFTTTIKATNIGNDDVQQHAFGDIIKRQIMAELRVNFSR